jgi:hypothetical protein
MRPGFSTLATISGGKLKLLSKEQYDRGVAQFADGQELVLIVEEVGRKRTDRQNRFFHGPVCAAFAELGWDEAYTKAELCLMFLPVEHTRPDGSMVIMPGHTSTLTVEEFNRFLEQVIQYAAENEVYIADADEWRAKRGAA